MVYIIYSVSLPPSVQLSYSLIKETSYLGVANQTSSLIDRLGLNDIKLTLTHSGTSFSRLSADRHDYFCFSDAYILKFRLQKTDKGETFLIECIHLQMR